MTDAIPGRAAESTTTPCPTTKTPYPTRSIAERQVRKHWLTGARRVYRCPWCDQYHMTSSPKRRDRA